MTSPTPFGGNPYLGFPFNWTGTGTTDGGGTGTGGTITPTGTIVPYVGTVPFGGEIRIPACTSPQVICFSYDGRAGGFVQRGNLRFSKGAGLVIPNDGSELVIKLDERRAYIQGPATSGQPGVQTNALGYLNIWQWFQFLPGRQDPNYSRNVIKFFAATTPAGPLRCYWWNAF